FRGRSLRNRSRMEATTGIWLPAHSMRCRPAAASPRSLTSYFIGSPGVFVDEEEGGPPDDRRPPDGRGRPPRLTPQQPAQRFDLVRPLPGELVLAAAEVPVGRRLLVDGTAEVQVL